MHGINTTAASVMRERERQREIERHRYCRVERLREREIERAHVFRHDSKHCSDGVSLQSAVLVSDGKA